PAATTARSSSAAPIALATWARSSAVSRRSPRERRESPARDDSVLLLSAARGRRGASSAELHAPSAHMGLVLHGGVRGGKGLLGEGRDPRRARARGHRGDPGAGRQRPERLDARGRRLRRTALGRHVRWAAPPGGLVAAAGFLRGVGK